MNHGADDGSRTETLLENFSESRDLNHGRILVLRNLPNWSRV
jgi:hypothetical protein